MLKELFQKYNIETIELHGHTVPKVANQGTIITLADTNKTPWFCYSRGASHKASGWSPNGLGFQASQEQQEAYNDGYNNTNAEKYTEEGKAWEIGRLDYNINDLRTFITYYKKRQNEAKAKGVHHSDVITNYFKPIEELEQLLQKYEHELEELLSLLGERHAT